MITPRTDPVIWLTLMITIACSALAARYRYPRRHGARRYTPPALHDGGRLCLVDVVRWHWTGDGR